MCPQGKGKEVSDTAEERRALGKGQGWDVLEGMCQCQS